MNTTKNNRVLITGFGPFPGVAENPSATLASELCHLAENIWPSHRFIPHVFATRWESIRPELQMLIDTHNPVLTLHFGLGNQKTALHIERQARNHASGAEDDKGCCTECGPIQPESPERLKTQLPIFNILTELKTQGINVHISDNAGDYLCNYLYYNALLQTNSARQPTITGFIHIPTCIQTKSSQSQIHRKSGRISQLNWTDLINAGLVLISHGLKKNDLA